MAGHFANDGVEDNGGVSPDRDNIKFTVILTACIILIVAAILAAVFSSIGGKVEDNEPDEPEYVLQDEPATQLQASQTQLQASQTQAQIAVQEPVEPKPVDKTYLRSAVELAWGIDGSNYSPESYAAMRAMINEGGVAATVLNDENATQAQVDDALDGLYAAINGLVEVLNPANYASVAYSDVARTPDAYDGQKLVFSGRVLQVVESSGETDLRIATDGEWDDVVMAGFDPSIIDYRILEDDYVTVYGTCVGIYTYTATMGQQISIPGIYCDYVVLQ